jgi:hypothetical protein
VGAEASERARTTGALRDGSHGVVRVNHLDWPPGTSGIHKLQLNSGSLVMEADFVYSTLFNFSVSLAYTISALLIAVISLKLIDKLLLRKLDIEEELKKNNLAVAIFASSILLFVALIVTIGLRN